MDTFQAMSILLRVAEAGSLSAAARDLKVRQPAVSKTIAALEAQLGVRLLVRTTRKLSLTEAGAAYLERARRALSEVEEAAIAARGIGAGLEGRLRVFAPVTFTRMHLVPRLQAVPARPPARSNSCWMTGMSTSFLKAPIWLCGSDRSRTRIWSSAS